MFILAAFILGQGVAASYYYWHHSDLWGRSTGVFPYVAFNLLNGAHWWVGDGIQWSFYFAIIGGIFAALYAMSFHARGVFFGARLTSDLSKPRDDWPKDRGDLP